MSPRLFGQPLERREDTRLLIGQGRYTDDVGHDVVQAAFARSELAHARIVDIDVSGALAVDGVLGVYTHTDLEGPFALPFPIGRPHDGIVAPRTPLPLAAQEVHYAGQPIVMVVARDRYVAEDAVDAIRVAYEPLPVVVDPEEAAEGRPGTAHSDMTDNLCALVTEEIGDVDAAFSSAEHVYEWRFELERAAGMPMEPRSVVADFDAAHGRLLVHDTTQLPMLVRTGLAGMFGLGLEDVEIVAGDLGGGFGPKLSPLYVEEALVPWASRTLGRPVKWTEDRREHFIGTNHLRKQVHHVRVGCTSEGRIVAFDDRFLHDSGAYCQFGVLVAQITAGHLSGPYKIPNLRYEMRAVYTNTVPTSPYRGAGIPYAVFALERTLDLIARELGLDRGEIRRRNFIQPDEFPHSVGVTYLHGGPAVYDSGDYPAGLELLLEELGYASFEEERRAAAERGRKIGLGLACYVEATGGGPYEGAKVSVMPDGSVTVSTGAASSGQGHETAFAQIAADELGVPIERISVRTGDSRRVSYGMGTYASRCAVVVGNAVHEASRVVRRKVAELAAGMLEASPDDIEVQDGTVRVAGAPQTELPLGQLAFASLYIPPQEGNAPGLSAEEYFAPTGTIFANGIHGAVVEIDPDTFDLTIIRYVAVHDCGRAINPLILEGQVVGGVAHGIGDSFYEQIAYDDAGQIQNASFMDYLIPYASEVPAVAVHRTETPSPVNPLGLKGAGEAGTIPVAAVLASAVEDALGTRILAMPLSPLKLFELTQQ